MSHDLRKIADNLEHLTSAVTLACQLTELRAFMSEHEDQDLTFTSVETHGSPDGSISVSTVWGKDTKDFDWLDAHWAREHDGDVVRVSLVHNYECTYQCIKDLDAGHLDEALARALARVDDLDPDLLDALERA